MILQFLYNGLNGIRTRNNNLDDILFMQNSPSYGIVAIYFFAKLLNSYNGNTISSSSSSSSNSSGENTINIKTKNYKNQQLLQTITCYYTSLMRHKINLLDIINFDSSSLSNISNINDISISSVSYASLIFTSINTYGIDNSFKKIEEFCSKYSKK
jgi:hypothetical protein